MATRTGRMYYVDDGNVVKKDSWEDEESGEAWETFDTVEEGTRRGLGSGTVIDYDGEKRASAADQEAQRQYSQRTRTRGTMNTAQNAVTDTGSSPMAQNAYDPRDPRIPPATYNQPSAAATPPPANPAAAAAAAAQSAQYPSGVPNAAAGTQNPQTIQNQRYNWDSPEFALMNALRDQGVGSTAGQPYLDVLMRAAPGLANAFRINSAMSGAGGNAQMDPQAAYGDFLRGAITGGVGGSGVVGALRGAQAQMPSLIDMLRSYSASISQGGQGQNWALNSLNTDMGQNSGMGAADMFGELQTPLMNRTTASGFANRLTGPMGIASEAMRRYMDPIGNRIVNGLPQNDYWRYLFGY